MAELETCQVCGTRPALGGNVRSVDGRDVRTVYCRECEDTVPIGHTVWMSMSPGEARVERMGWLIVGGVAATIVGFVVWRFVL